MIECMRTEATRKTVTEQRWIPVKYHELTEEERKECLFSADIKYMIDCELPDDEQEIIVTDGRHVWVDTCIVNDGYALDSGHDWIEDVIAWMPLPESYSTDAEKPHIEKPQTNADRIRSMTDEELLDFLCSIETYEQGSVKTIEGGVAMCSVTEVEQWLKAESEG